MRNFKTVEAEYKKAWSLYKQDKSTKSYHIALELSYELDAMSERNDEMQEDINFSQEWQRDAMW